MKNTRAKFDKELEQFKEITQEAKKRHNDLSYKLPDWLKPEAILKDEFFKEFDYQITLLKAQTGSAVHKSFEKFSAVSRSLAHFKGIFFGDTILDSVSDQQSSTCSKSNVTITLRTPFRMEWRKVPVTGEVSCVVSMKRIYEYAKTGGPSVHLQADIDMFDGHDDKAHIDLWIQDQSMEDLFAEFKKKLNEGVSMLKQHRKLFAKMKANK